MTITNFFESRGGNHQRSDAEINDILGTPKYTRKDLLALTRPRVDSARFQSWMRRGYLDPKLGSFVGNAKEIRKAAELLEENERLGVHMRYGGAHVLTCMILDVLSQSGLPFDLAKQLSDDVFHRAVEVLRGDDQPAVMYVYREDVGYKIQLVRDIHPIEDLLSDWFTVVNCDLIIARFLDMALEAKQT
jgi:hypothetical protein